MEQKWSEITTDSPNYRPPSLLEQWQSSFERLWSCLLIPSMVEATLLRLTWRRKPTDEKKCEVQGRKQPHPWPWNELAFLCVSMRSHKWDVILCDGPFFPTTTRRSSWASTIIFYVLIIWHDDENFFVVVSNIWHDDEKNFVVVSKLYPELCWR